MADKHNGIPRLLHLYYLTLVSVAWSRLRRSWAGNEGRANASRIGGNGGGGPPPLLLFPPSSSSTPPLLLLPSSFPLPSGSSLSSLSFLPPPPSSSSSPTPVLLPYSSVLGLG
jgi:hypothetical protein